MTPQAVNVASALDDLCRLAACAPAESTPEAGDRIARALQSLGVRVSLDNIRSPCDCPLAVYLVAQCPGLTADPDDYDRVRLMVGTGRSLLRHPKVGGATWERVPMPAAIIAAVDVIGGLRHLGLVETKREAA